MRLALFAFTRKGCGTAREISGVFPGETRMVTMEKFGLADFEPYHAPLSQCMEPYFHWADLIVFVGSTGMAVRGLAPHLVGKTSDPGVLVVDEEKQFVISLLSGHLGGANAAAKTLARALGAAPVLTTATDVSRRFSADAWAGGNGVAISDMTACKHISAAILEGNVPMKSDFPLNTYPNGVVPGNTGPLGIYLGFRKEAPFAETLQLIPPVLTLGIGCRRGIAKEAVEEAVCRILAENRIDPRAVFRAASIDLKKDEEGLLAFCESRSLPITFYPPQELQKAPGRYSASAFVKSITGVDNVCQRAAMLENETLIVEKTAWNGVTVSVAARHWEAVF